MRFIVCVCLSAAISTGVAFANPPAGAAVPTLPAGKLAPAAAAPVIDGHVDDEAWRDVTPHTGFIQQDPIEGDPASERTEVRILVGKGNVYVGIICFDSDPSKIIVSQSRRDAALTDTDAIILVFDTFNDSQNAFVFGTNPLGIEYDGQVSGEGQTGGSSQQGQGGSGSQRGGISAFNPNWDGDWTVRSSITERGWEAELAIPLKTLRYATGDDRTWGFNVMRNIRRKNEQVYLAPIPRGFDIYRVSLAAKLTGLDLPGRRDLKLIPYALASANKDYLLASGDQLDRNAEVGVDLKWGMTPNMTLDFTVNTDFAQVEADEEQVNLTRFDLFFPEKRPFFLENASTFQFGNPQQIDLFFSRRIGLSGLGASGVPLDIPAGARVSGKMGAWRVGFLDIQTGEAFLGDEGDPNRRLLAPGNNFGVARVQREIGRSSFGGIFVNRQATGSNAGDDNWNRSYGVDANVAVSQNSRVFAFIAGTSSPGSVGTDTAGRIFYDFRNNLWQISGGYSQVGSNFNPEVGFLPRRGYRRPEFRAFLQYQPKQWTWIRRISPHVNYDAFHDINTGDIQSARAHLHFFEIQPANGGRFGTSIDVSSDRPLTPFVVYNTGGKRVVIPPGYYTWQQLTSEYLTDPSAVASFTLRHRIGGFYDGDFQSVQFDPNVRIGSRFVGSVGWTWQSAKLDYGDFITNLITSKASYAFTTLASIQALLQYNSQSSQFSSNIRLALLNRSGTGLFLVYNDRQDTTDFTPIEALGRSFIIKYTRLLDF